MINFTNVSYLTLVLFLFIPHCLKATLPWPSNAETIGTGGNMIDYDKSPAGGITLTYIMPFQLKELSVKLLKADIEINRTLFSGEIAQSGDIIFQETLLTFTAGKLLSENFYLRVGCSNYHQNSVNGAKGNALLTEIQFLYQPDKHIILGSCIFNPTGSIIKNQFRDFKLDQSFHFGCSVFPEKNISLFFEFGKTLGESSKWHIGTEYNLMKALKLSMGFSGDPLIVSWGVGWKIKKTDFSTGASLHPVLGMTTAISIKHHWKSN